MVREARHRCAIDHIGSMGRAVDVEFGLYGWYSGHEVQSGVRYDVEGSYEECTWFDFRGTDGTGHGAQELHGARDTEMAWALVYYGSRNKMIIGDTGLVGVTGMVLDTGHQSNMGHRGLGVLYSYDSGREGCMRQLA